ncbi:MAG TPA: ATP-binding cassette domain-containing protein [Terriglobales bacterium]|jgi:putative ABC transport system ATP-binding protein|nr:ATP-binding cassette domain-containing protein [Terriglobales bacterium]
MAIRIDNVSKLYPAKAEGGGVLRALDGVSLQVSTGEWLAVMGPSGSGKSTLVNIIGCLDRPTSGEILIGGENLAQYSTAQLDRFRAEKIGFIFQQFHLIPYLTALENVMLAQYFHSMTDEGEALAALERVGLRGRAQHLPAHLSGGEQQRVCIARALINDPQIILADEPTGNLDAQNEEIVLHLLRRFHNQGRTIVMVTHDPAVARLADRKVELHHGRIAEQETFKFSDEEQFDEVLEEIWTLKENGVPAEVGRMHVSGPLPVTIAVEKMKEMGLLLVLNGAQSENGHKEVLNRCHEMIYSESAKISEEQNLMVDFTPRGEQRAANIIRRHRLAERLFMETLHIENEAEVEQQACKFEHILSFEATDKICTFLGHPKTCPHGSPIPPGCCCTQARVANLQK